MSAIHCAVERRLVLLLLPTASVVKVSVPPF
jgi:hypothetical protein